MDETPSEKTQAKAAEYLLSGQVKVQDCRTLISAPYFTFVAHVMSASQEPGDPYIVRWNASGWHCDCPARVQVCSHILACVTITDAPGIQNPEKVELPHSADIDAILGGL